VAEQPKKTNQADYVPHLPSFLDRADQDDFVA
jgi:hypothetical protein